MILPEALRKLYKRDLEKLKTEISQYKTEETIWITDGAIANSAGNLCLHLVGNLNTYIGAILGNTGYIRDREAEFSLKGLSKQQLVKIVEETIDVVDKTLSTLSEDDMPKEYPTLIFEPGMTTGYFLVHLATHLGYHLGQINYHRRLLDI